jgi:hypothetical protein
LPPITALNILLTQTQAYQNSVTRNAPETLHLIATATQNEASQLKTIDNPDLANPGRIPAVAIDSAAAAGWFGSLNALEKYFASQAPQAASRFTVVMSEVEVETSAGPVQRLVAFVSKSGLPRQLENELDNQGVTIIEADQLPGVQGHAEVAAQQFRADTEAQVEDLGGPITKVNSAVMNNGACSAECAQALTDYIDREGVTVVPGGRGVLGDEVLNPAEMAALRAEYGGVSNYEAIIRSTPTAGDVAAEDPEGDEAP